MEGSRLLVPVAHGEGRAVFDAKTGANKAIMAQIAPLQYVDNKGEKYSSESLLVAKLVMDSL